MEMTGTTVVRPGRGRRAGEASAGEPFREARRELTGVTARVEERALAWLAARTPGWVGPDHLTGLGLLAMALAGLFYAASARFPGMLLGVNLALVLNWLGDSLDGTLARHRGKLRPRWGFYVDHLVDAVGALFLLGGMALSGLVSPPVAAILLIAYYLLNLEIYLATYTLGRFRISYGRVGGTELRILLAALNLGALAWPSVEVLGRSVRLLDLVGLGGAFALVVTLAGTAVRNGRELYRQERI